MRTDIYKLTGQEDQRARIVADIDRFTAFNGLDKRSSLRVRLLTEETLGMVPELLKITEGSFWIENDGTSYELHVSAKTKDSGFSTREKLVSVATSGNNAAEKGFMGKLRAAIEMMLYPSEEDLAVTEMYGFSFHDVDANAEDWSLLQFRKHVEENGSENEKARVWDELEKSIVASLADNVTVSIRGKQAELVICKKFDTGERV